MRDDGKPYPGIQQFSYRYTIWEYEKIYTSSDFLRHVVINGLVRKLPEDSNGLKLKLYALFGLVEENSRAMSCPNLSSVERGREA